MAAEQSTFIIQMLDSEQHPRLLEENLPLLNDRDLSRLRLELNKPLKLQQAISKQQEAILKRKLRIVLSYNDNLRTCGVNYSKIAREEKFTELQDYWCKLHLLTASIDSLNSGGQCHAIPLCLTSKTSASGTVRPASSCPNNHPLACTP
ncbi:hypothetical protein [Poriferisphaera sp. WC338]|uniref:hypothetical protein n=1 Tax=Poriferisphaera sp. WC338 TaxID=3425129 RepID=UPI003D8154AD